MSCLSYRAVLPNTHVKWFGSLSCAELFCVRWAVGFASAIAAGSGNALQSDRNQVWNGLTQITNITATQDTQLRLLTQDTACRFIASPLK